MLRCSLLSLLLIMGACGPNGTWTRSGASTDAHVYMAPAPQALAKAIDWWVAREHGAPPKEIPIWMVPSLDPAAPKVLELVPGAKLVDATDPAAIRIEALRLSFQKASIDLSAPRKGLPRQLITIDMAGYGGPWRVTGANWWRFNERQIREVHDGLKTASDQQAPEQNAEAAQADGDS
ncbi:MAG: hypothetical protein MK101_02205 [Phycisphaerales bacterium]|nr:hypothetical protein [Phycisphaerales bacterium]